MLVTISLFHHNWICSSNGNCSVKLFLYKKLNNDYLFCISSIYCVQPAYHKKHIWVLFNFKTI